jgi:hypothetical protein
MKTAFFALEFLCHRFSLMSLNLLVWSFVYYKPTREQTDEQTTLNCLESKIIMLPCSTQLNETQAESIHLHSRSKLVRKLFLLKFESRKC